MGAIRRTLQSDGALRAAARRRARARRLRGRDRSRARSVARSVRGPEQPVSEFLWAGACDSNRAVRPRAHGFERNRLGRQGGASSGMSEPRQPRQQDDFYSVFSAEHRHQSERRRGRCHRRRRTCSSNARCNRCRCRFTLRSSSLLGIAFGSVIGRLHDAARGRCRRCGVAALYFGGRVLAVHELLRLVAAGRTAARAVARRSSVWRSGGTIARSPCSASASEPRSGITCRSPLRGG